MAQLKDRYADALFEMSLESGELEVHLGQAALVRGQLKARQLTDLLENPYVSRAAKRELLEELFGSRISSELMGFLYLVIEKGHGAMLLPTLDAYIGLGERHRGSTTAYVVSATALSAEQVGRIGGLLSKKLGKRIEILAREDPALIGGFSIHVDGRLIDRTVRTHLRNLKESLKKGGPDDRKTQ